jgi:hypothetical protein
MAGERNKTLRPVQLAGRNPRRISKHFASLVVDQLGAFSLPDAHPDHKASYRPKQQSGSGMIPTTTLLMLLLLLALVTPEILLEVEDFLLDALGF